MSQQYPPQGQQPPSHPSTGYQQPQPPYPGQQYPQPPFYQNGMPPMQPAPQPPRKRRRPFLIGCGVLAALFVLVIVIVAIATAATSGGKGASNTPPAAAATSQQNTTASTPATKPTSIPTSATNGVGTHVTSGIWQLTINTVKTSTGNQFNTPGAGNIYLVINFTAKNTDASNQNMNPFDFTLRDGQGTTYQYTVIEENNNPDGTVVGGQQLRGELTYEVPKATTTYTLQFDPPSDLDSSQVVQWQIKD